MSDKCQECGQRDADGHFAFCFVGRAKEAEADLAAARAEIERLKYELSAYKDVRRDLVDANRELAALRAQAEAELQKWRPHFRNEGWRQAIARILPMLDRLGNEHGYIKTHVHDLLKEVPPGDAQSEAAVRLAEAFVGYHDARVSHLALRQAEDAYRAARASTKKENL